MQKSTIKEKIMVGLSKAQYDTYMKPDKPLNYKIVDQDEKATSGTYKQLSAVQILVILQHLIKQQNKKYYLQDLQMVLKIINLIKYFI